MRGAGAIWVLLLLLLLGREVARVLLLLWGRSLGVVIGRGTLSVVEGRRGGRASLGSGLLSWS